MNPVPSLFTFNIKILELKNCQAAALATVKVKDTKLESTDIIIYPLGNERTNRFKIISLETRLCMTKISVYYLRKLAE
jgi:hypothetical protein